MNIDVLQWIENSREQFWHMDLLAAYGVNDPIAGGVLAFVLGTCFGSFINLVAHRSLNRESWIHPASHCPQCKKNIAVWDLVPIVSYMLLKGKCRNCQANIPFYYPLVELATGILFVVLLRKYGWSPDGAAMCLFTCTLMAVTVTDFREKLIPHEITYPAILIGLTYFAIRHNSIADALIGAG
ncbi:MAG TPA: prepilin peptidase, partial [Nitrososphaera sp.]|nr:prepilin peptidase [Nitrososphaera sp.]